MLILKGFIIGLGKIIPGVSGSMLAISIGLYEKLIYSINSFFKDIVSNSKFLIKVMSGVLISIVLFSKLITLLLEKYYIITIFSFIGLICGSLDKYVRKANFKKNNKLFFLVFFSIIILNFCVHKNSIIINNHYLKLIYWFFAGFLEAFSTVVPGISGTSMLMLIGAYDKIMIILSNMFNIYTFIYNFWIILPFICGMIMGIFLVAKLISYLLDRYDEKLYSIICSFSYSSIIIMIISCFKKNISIINSFISVILFFMFFYISKKVNHLYSD